MNTNRNTKLLKKYGLEGKAKSLDLPLEKLSNLNIKNNKSERSASDISEAGTERGSSNRSSRNSSEIIYKTKIRAKSLPIAPVLEKKQEGLIKTKRGKSEILDKNRKIIKKLLNSNNYNFKPSYISAIKTGSDFSYLYLFDILNEEIINNINNNKKRKDSNYTDGLLKCCFMFLNKTKNYGSEKKGGNCSFIPAHILQEKFLEFQYVFDNKHDFDEFSDNIPDEFYFNEANISYDELKPYFKIEQPVLFKELLKKSNKIVDNILFFSVYNLAEYKKNNPNIVGRVIINNDEQLKLIKENTSQFIKDILVSDNLKFISDGNLNVGVKANIPNYCIKLNNAGILDGSKIKDVTNNVDSWLKIKEQIKTLINTSRFYTYEDMFDSYPINPDTVISKLNDVYTTQTPNEINKYAFITNLIYNDIDFNTSSLFNDLQQYIESFKAYTKELRMMFSNVYYLDGSKIGTAIIFNDTSILTDTISTSSIKIIYLKKDTTNPNNYIYNKELSKNSDNYYAIDLVELKKNYESAQTFNARTNIVEMISILKSATTLQDLIQRFNGISGTSTKSIRFKYNLLLLIYISKYIEKLNNPSHNNSMKLTVDSKIKIAHCLFNLKRAGDMGKILFAYFYNCLKNTPQFTSTIDLCYSGNDKLAVLNSIVRQGNSVIFPDTTNYAFSIYNINDKNFTFLSFMGLLNMYLIPKFIDNNYDIFNRINELLNISKTRREIVQESSFDINFIFKNINHESVFIKENGVEKTGIEIFQKMLQNLLTSLINETPIQMFTSLTDFRQQVSTIVDIYINLNNPQPLERSDIQLLKQKLVNLNQETGDLNNLLNYIYKLNINSLNYDYYFDESKTQNKINHINKINKLIQEIKNDEDTNQPQSMIDIKYSKLNYYKMLHYFSLIYHTKNIITKIAQTDIDNLISDYFKNLVITYLDHIRENIIQNLTNETIINFYLKEIIFYRIDLEYSSYTEIKQFYYLLTKKLLTKILINIDSIIAKIIDIIKTNTTFNLLKVESIRNLFININKFLKIIDVFLFIDINKNNEILENENNIHFCMQKLKYYIYDLLTIKNTNISIDRNPRANRFGLTYENLLKDRDYTLLSSILTPIQNSEFEDRTIGIKCKNLTTTLFKNLSNLNYVILFNLLYEELNTFVEINIFDKNLVTECQELRLLINQIKKIYKYAYAEVHSEIVNNKKFDELINHIIELIEVKAKKTIEAYEKDLMPSSTSTDKRKRKFTNPINREKIDFFKKITSELLHEINYNIKPHFLSMEKRIYEDRISRKYDNLEDIRYILGFDIDEDSEITPKTQLDIYKIPINEANMSQTEIRNNIIPINILLRDDGYFLTDQQISSFIANTNQDISKLGKNYDYFISN